MPVRARVALAEEAVAELAELLYRGFVAVGEVRIAISELLCEVELEPLCDLAAAFHRGPVIREAVVHLVRREQHRLVVAAPFALAAVERGAVADGDERVLKADAGARVCVRVAGGDRCDTDCLGEVAQRCVPPHVAAFVRPLQLDEEPVSAERLREPRGGVRVANGEAVPCAAGEAHESFVQLLQQRLVERRRHRLRLASGRTCVLVRRGQQPAEVRVAARRLDEQRHMRRVGERDFRAGDRTDAERLCRVGELERAVEAVVVGERQRLVAELRRANGQFFGQRCPVQKGIRRMSVELDESHQPKCAVGCSPWSGRQGCCSPTCS